MKPPKETREMDGLWVSSLSMASVVSTDQDGYKRGWWEDVVTLTLTSRRGDLWKSVKVMDDYDTWKGSKLLIPMEVL